MCAWGEHPARACKTLEYRNVSYDPFQAFCVRVGHLHGENLEVGTSGTSVSFLDGSEKTYILKTSQVILD